VGAGLAARQHKGRCGWVHWCTDGCVPEVAWVHGCMGCRGAFGAAGQGQRCLWGWSAGWVAACAELAGAGACQGGRCRCGCRGAAVQRCCGAAVQVLRCRCCSAVQMQMQVQVQVLWCRCRCRRGAEEGDYPDRQRADVLLHTCSTLTCSTGRQAGHVATHASAAQRAGHGGPAPAASNCRGWPSVLLNAGCAAIK
jgi:hypothetical protein